MVVVGNLVLEKIPANLSVDEKASLACGDISAHEWDLDAVAKARGRVKAGRSGVVRLRPQIADGRTHVHVPAIHIQPGDVRADLNAGEISHRARIANDIAGDGSAKVYVPGCCGCAVAEVAGDAAGPRAATLLVRLRIGRSPDERAGL